MIQILILLSRASETESIAVLTMLISKYKVEVKEEPQFVNETFEQKKARVLNCRAGLTVTWVKLLL